MRNRPANASSRFICPVCGGEVPEKARACPNCGSDEQTGWSNQTHLDGVELPGIDDEFDYDEALGKEFGQKSVKSRRKPWKSSMTWMAVVGGVLLALFVVGILRGVF